MLKKQNEQRQQDIKKDTDQLLELATELKQYVDKTNENIISLDVIKKAEQIEKLAKNVKDKMKGPQLIRLRSAVPVQESVERQANTKRHP